MLIHTYARILFRATIARLTRKKHNLVSRGNDCFSCMFTARFIHHGNDKILVIIKSEKLLVDRVFERN